MCWSQTFSRNNVRIIELVPHPPKVTRGCQRPPGVRETRESKKRPLSHINHLTGDWCVTVNSNSQWVDNISRVVFIITCPLLPVRSRGEKGSLKMSRQQNSRTSKKFWKIDIECVAVQVPITGRYARTGKRLSEPASSASGPPGPGRSGPGRCGRWRSAAPPPPTPFGSAAFSSSSSRPGNSRKRKRISQCCFLKRFCER